MSKLFAALTIVCILCVLANVIVFIIEPNPTSVVVGAFCAVMGAIPFTMFLKELDR